MYRKQTGASRQSINRNPTHASKRELVSVLDGIEVAESPALEPDQNAEDSQLAFSTDAHGAQNAELGSPKNRNSMAIPATQPEVVPN